MEKKSFFLGIGLNVIILGLVSLLTDLSSQMVFPLIPLYLTSILGAGAYIVGIVEGAADSTASLLKVVSGYWSDKIKRRKPFVLIGYSISTITKPLFALATTWPVVLFVRVIERIGKGLRDAPRDAIVAESVDKRYLGKAYGFQRAMDSLGSVLGGVLAFLLLPIYGYKNLFLFAFIPGVIAVFAILLVQEKKKINEKVEKINFKVSFKELPRNLKLFILAATVFALGHFGYAFLLLKAKNVGFADNTAILLYVLFYVTCTLVTIPAGILSDKFGRKPLLVLSYFLFIFTSFGLIFAEGWWIMLLFFAVYGVFFAIMDSVQRAFVVDLAPKHLKGTALGTFHTAIGLVALPGGYIAGLLWDKISPEATFIYAILLSLVSLLFFVLVKNNE